MNLETFWSEAERSKLEVRFSLAKELQRIEHVSTRALREILLQYRFFTAAFTSDLAVLIARSPASRFRSFLGEVLRDELGFGDPAKAHPRMFDRFLISLGAMRDSETEAQVAARIHPEVSAIIDELTRATATRSLSYAVGLRGMGGECVCGVYFIEMFAKMVKHPLFAERGRDAFDWEFWDIHAGHADVEHDREARAVIVELLRTGELDVAELAAGYRSGVDTWDRFWRALYGTFVGTCETDPRRVTVRNAVRLEAAMTCGARTYDALVHNLSDAGALVESKCKMAPGTRLQLALPASKGGQRFDARIQWTEPERHQYGVRFIDVLAS